MSVDDEATLELLRAGELELTAALDAGANAAFAATVTAAGQTLRCVYKPRRGERPLWDFPSGNLAGREVATYLVDKAAGLGVTPQTVLRDGPFGLGSLQRWIDNDAAAAAELVDVRALTDIPAGWRTVVRGEDPIGRPAALGHADDVRLRRLALLDAVTNNADRKASHIYCETDALFGIDHGLTFNVEPKLRTVLWGFVGDQFDEPERAALELLAKQLDATFANELAEHLTVAEVGACRERVSQLLETDQWPAPNPNWPALPWPLF